MHEIDKKLDTLLAGLRELFAGDASGHDYFHTLRVYHNAMKIAETEDCDREIVALAALLHDADDPKLFQTAHYANARRLLGEYGAPEATVQGVLHAISTVSFKGADTVTPETAEGKIVQDADRLDAMGAIGIARAFAYGGSRGRAMYDPDEPPVPNMNEAQYCSSRGHTVNHFYEKLLLLKDLMNTPTAKAMASARDAYMRGFLQEFFSEWEGKQ